MSRLAGVFVLLAALGAAATAAEAAAVRVQILSAVVKDQKIAGATVILQKNGDQSVTATTDAHGDAVLTPAFSETADGVLVLVKQNGYSTLVARCPCDGMTYAISPVMTSLDGLRIVLNWGASPADLDSHLVYPRQHIFWSWRAGPDANLDVDDRDGFGPETITVEKKHFGEKYVYAVHDYTQARNSTSRLLSRSGAKVFVYIGRSLIRAYYVPPDGVGNLWVVFAVDGNGEIHDINRVEGAPATGEALDEAALVRYLGEDRYTAAVLPSQDTAAEAARLNKLGEAAYHAQRLDEAIEHYRAALDLDPELGQAYSNLGLAYQKAGRTAEAIWANRKAIALAHGPSANVVRASSYYNVARIYEEAGQLADALAQYQLALAEKPGRVYTDAVARVKAKAAR